MGEKYTSEFDVVIPSDEYEWLVRQAYKYDTLVSTLLKETSLGYDGSYLVVDIGNQDALTLVKAFEPLSYTGRLEMLAIEKKREESKKVKVNVNAEN